MTKRILVLFALLLTSVVWWQPAQAARSFSAGQTSPTSPGQFNMGTTQSVTMNITNTSTGGNADERIFQVTFKLPSCTAPCTTSTFSSSTAAPSGWTRSAFSANAVTFRASGFATALGSTAQSPQVPPLSQSFTLVLAIGSFIGDVTESFSQITSRVSPNTNFGGAHNINCTNAGTCNSLGSWKNYALKVTSFQTTDTLGNAISALAAGNNFQLRIAIQNISSASQSFVCSNPNPPTTTKSGTWPGANPNLTSTSASLTLAAGASGTITFTYSTTSAVSGSVFFTANAQKFTNSNCSGNPANPATSQSVTSNTLSVSPLTASIAVTPSLSCLFPGGTATFKMSVSNNTGAAVTNVVPKDASGTSNTLTVTTANNATVGALSGPTISPAACNVALTNGSTCDFTWTATANITGSYPTSGPQPSFSASGYATACSGASCPPSSTINTPNSPPPSSIAQVIGEYVVSVSPSTVNASRVNQELDWKVTNLGCTGVNVNSVAITAPAGWTVSSDSTYAYSLVFDTNDTTQATDELWTVSGTTFSTSTISQYLPVSHAGDYFVLYSQTPSSAGTSNFTVVVTDAGGNTRTQTIPVTVNTLTPGSTSAPSTWREVFQ